MIRHMRADEAVRIKYDSKYYESRTVKEEVRKKRKEEKVYDFTFGKKILSVIYLKSGELILTNTLIATLNNRMEEKED